MEDDQTWFCPFCGEPYDENDMEHLDQNERGYWCDSCDRFVFWNEKVEQQQRSFHLVLEEKASSNHQVANPKQYVFKKRLSPLRYPGGKSKVINNLYPYIHPDYTEVLVSPYCGGASLELAYVQAGLFRAAHLNDVDYGIYALFSTIFEDPEPLINRIRFWSLSHEDFEEARDVVKKEYDNVSRLDAAWFMLVCNRLAYSGIYYANPLGGKHGSLEKLLSRWNPKDLVQRIRTIHELRHLITISNEDAFSFIEEEYWLPAATLFLDPPYVGKGKTLYRHYYEKEEHEALAELLDSLYHEFPNAHLLVTYDDVPFTHSLFTHAAKSNVERYFSI
ncbi:DNA adenine methylase [Salibacterium aidingense]|uniref:DNA adenine methylase n=1 Tax=Salibacterium aidingense TaxID=384933 RepID=UPI00040B5E45|nr:DNA adenine methylase [Salibacterium aidingense]